VLKLIGLFDRGRWGTFALVFLPDKIVTADLEALITKDGLNQIYMAAWYNGSNFKVLDITNYGNNSHSMLQDFWVSLLTECKGARFIFTTGQGMMPSFLSYLS
jgi:hypothetical protein